MVFHCTTLLIAFVSLQVKPKHYLMKTLFMFTLEYLFHGHLTRQAIPLPLIHHREQVLESQWLPKPYIHCGCKQ